MRKSLIAAVAVIVAALALPSIGQADDDPVDHGEPDAGEADRRRSSSPRRSTSRS